MPQPAARFQALCAAAEVRRGIPAVEAKLRGCGRCGGRLDCGWYPRKPRVSPAVTLPATYDWRFSYSCATCRKRCTPASARFLGRRVYVGAVVVLATAMQQGTTQWRASQLRELLGVSLQYARPVAHVVGGGVRRERVLDGGAGGLLAGGRGERGAELAARALRRGSVRTARGAAALPRTAVDRGGLRPGLGSVMASPTTIATCRGGDFGDRVVCAIDAAMKIRTHGTHDTRTLGPAALLGGRALARRAAGARRLAARARTVSQEEMAAPGHRRTDDVWRLDDPALVLRGEGRAGGSGGPTPAEGPQGSWMPDRDHGRARAGDPALHEANRSWRRPALLRQPGGVGRGRQPRWARCRRTRRCGDT